MSDGAERAAAVPRWMVILAVVHTALTTLYGALLTVSGLIGVGAGGSLVLGTMLTESSVQRAGNLIVAIVLGTSLWALLGAIRTLRGEPQALRWPALGMSLAWGVLGAGVYAVLVGLYAPSFVDGGAIAAGVMTTVLFLPVGAFYAWVTVRLFRAGSPSESQD